MRDWDYVLWWERVWRECELEGCKEGWIDGGAIIVFENSVMIREGRNDDSISRKGNFICGNFSGRTLAFCRIHSDIYRPLFYSIVLEVTERRVVATTYKSHQTMQKHEDF